MANLQEYIPINVGKHLRIDRVSNNLWYVGYVNSPVALPTDKPFWSIQQLVVDAEGQVLVNWANNGLYTSIWDDRTTYFDVVQLANTKSVSFDGVNDYINFGDSFLYDRTTQFSMSFWIKPNNLSASYCIYSKVSTDAAVNGFNIQTTSAGKVFIQARAGAVGPTHTGAISLTAGVWQHILVTYSGSSNMSGFKIYVNGVLDTIPSSSALSGTWLAGYQAIIGSRAGTVFYYVGNIDEVSFWNVELTQAQVDEIYNSGSPYDLTQHSVYNQLASWFRMGDGDNYPTLADSKGAVIGTMTNMLSSDIEEDVP